MYDYLKNLIEDMIDEGMLPTLSAEEIDELTHKAIDGLLRYILEVF